jgi:hypothetical protein
MDTIMLEQGMPCSSSCSSDGPGSGGRWVEGINYIKIDTGVGDTITPNSLATPAVVDVDSDFTADYLIAGDLRENMWRTNVTSTATIGTNRDNEPTGCQAWRRITQ